MRGSTHIILGVMAGVTAHKHLHLEINEISWFPLLVGSIAPDIDEERSKAANAGSFLSSLLPRWLVSVVNLCSRTVSSIVKAVLGHRGFLHWPVVGIALIYFGLALDLKPLLWFGIGYLIHILADACTVGGVPLLAPIYTRPIRWSPIRTGSILESVFAVMCVGYLIYSELWK